MYLNQKWRTFKEQMKKKKRDRFSLKNRFGKKQETSKKNDYPLRITYFSNNNKFSIIREFYSCSKRQFRQYQ